VVLAGSQDLHMVDELCGISVSVGFLGRKSESCTRSSDNQDDLLLPVT